MNNLLSQLIYVFRALVEKLVARFTLVGQHPFYNSEEFKWIELLEDNYKEIQKELFAIIAAQKDIPNIQELFNKDIELSNDNGWKTYFLQLFFNRVEHNRQECPKTAELLDNVPNLVSAFFSILGPEKHIPAHRGFFNGILRYHLGLIVPVPHTDCLIRVNNDYRSWEEGRSLIFDDTYSHEVWNNSAHIRIVLILDFVRPLNRPLTWLITKFYKWMGKSGEVNTILQMIN